MNFCQPTFRIIHFYQIVAKALCFLILFTIFHTTTSVQTSSAEEYVGGAISKPRLRLFSGLSDDPIAFHEKILRAKYHLFELGNNIQTFSLTPPVFSQNGKSVHYISWLFNRFDSNSNGLRIKPVLKSGVHISYRLDF
jgi:hypothetical protein